MHLKVRDREVAKARATRFPPPMWGRECCGTALPHLSRCIRVRVKNEALRFPCAATKGPAAGETFTSPRRLPMRDRAVRRADLRCALNADLRCALNAAGWQRISQLRPVEWI